MLPNGGCMKVIIAGGRDFNDMNLLIDIMNKLYESGFLELPIEVVCGEARGADLLGRDLAINQQWVIHSFPAKWKTHGKSAGYHRNADMGKFADVLVAFWDGKSRGTKHMIDFMHQLNKPVSITYY